MADIAEVPLAAQTGAANGTEPHSRSPAWRARASSRTPCRWSSAPSCSSTSAASPSSWRRTASTPRSRRSTRSATSPVTSRRAAASASRQWLGDGAMLIGTEIGPAIAAAAELIARYDANTLALRGGIADGWALLFDGDDYIGRPVNLAARLCQAARPGELLGVGYPPETFPAWMQVLGTARPHAARASAGSAGSSGSGIVPGTELPGALVRVRGAPPLTRPGAGARLGAC